MSQKELKVVLQELSARSGYQFIYSSNKLNANTRISFSINNGTLNDVLTILTHQTNLSFKKVGQYYIVKPQPMLPKPQVRKRKPDHLFAYSSTDTITGTIQPVEFQPVSSGSINGYYFKRHLVRTHPYLDTSWVKRLPLQEMKKLKANTRHAGWFFSAGVMMNDYAAGGEFQVGVRRLYAVVAPSWLTTGRFHGAYGLGTTINLNYDFGLNIVYTYAYGKDNSNLQLTTPSYTETISLKHVTGHHQVKLLPQITITENFEIKIGPTLNYITDRQQAPLFPEVSDMATITSPDQARAFYNTRATSTTPLHINKQTLTRSRAWMGWQAGVSYRINFFAKR